MIDHIISLGGQLIVSKSFVTIIENLIRPTLNNGVVYCIVVVDSVVRTCHTTPCTAKVKFSWVYIKGSQHHSCYCSLELLDILTQRPAQFCPSKTSSFPLWSAMSLLQRWARQIYCRFKIWTSDNQIMLARYYVAPAVMRWTSNRCRSPLGRSSPLS